MAWIGYIAVIIIGIAATVAAILQLWKTVFRPAANFVTLIGEMLPLLKRLVKVFGDAPNTFEVLDDIAAQFRTDSGSSLRDAVNGLTASALEQKAATETLRIVAEAAKLASEEDHLQRERLILRIDRLTVRVDAGAATGLRNEEAAKHVAEDLAEAHRLAEIEANQK